MRDNLAKETFVLLSLGSNIGDKLSVLDEAVDRLIELNIISKVKSSSFYQTEPYGVKEQAWFVNICVSGLTALQPLSLLEECKKIENLLGRQKRERWHEREIDIDIIFYGNEIIKSEILTVPHVEYRNRNFVLIPAIEICGSLIPPDSEYNLSHIARECKDISKVTKM